MALFEPGSEAEVTLVSRNFRKSVLEDSQDDPPYDRLRLDFADGHHLAYVNPRLLGRVGLARDAAEFIAAERLGPDALDPRFDLAAFEQALAGRKRNVKSVLMESGGDGGYW